MWSPEFRMFYVENPKMTSAISWVDRSLLRAVRRIADPVHVQVAAPGMSSPAPRQSPEAPTIWVDNRRTLAALLLNPEVSFGDAYSEGRLDIVGDIISVLETLFESTSRVSGWNLRLVSAWLQWIQSNSLDGSHKNIHHHYDLPTDFYKLWLDRQMLYTCAYFPDRTATLEEAQRAKLDLVCQKLWLQPGETVAEAGCGWGALSLYMAKHYGVRVKAFNISHEQIVFARARAKDQGLTSQVEFIEEDYRNIRGHFDAFVSLGMVEHVGAEHYSRLGGVIHGAIGDSGRGLLHFIGRNYPQPFSVWIRKRVFPGAYAPALREAMQMLEPSDFSVLDVENLRPHYAKTLECWLQRFERSYESVAQRFGSDFARMWRLYLAGSIAAFNVGALQLFQIVFAGRKCRGIPWTRNHLGKETAERQQQDQPWIHAMP
jgi:cyclopropane-fatty-acyl-phospholipid synthase